MSNYASYTQLTSETKTYTIDFTASLPAGGTISAGAATHYPPSGSATTPMVSVTSPYLYVTFIPGEVTGIHYIDALATFSDGDEQGSRFEIDVLYPDTACRSGMGTLVQTMRELTDAGASDFTLAGQKYWTDAHLQTVLDRHVVDFTREEATPVTTYDGAGSPVYKTYWLPFGNLESGTAFELETADGATAGTALYTVDYVAGKITFSANTSGIAYYANGRSYDINAAASDIWKVKAANASKMFDFSTDNHSIKKSAFIKNCLEMAQYYTTLAGIQVGEMERGDM